MAPGGYFLATESVTLGNIVTRMVTPNMSQNIDMFAARRAVPLGAR
jgi:hypothetical protein